MQFNPLPVSPFAICRERKFEAEVEDEVTGRYFPINFRPTFFSEMDLANGWPWGRWPWPLTLKPFLRWATHMIFLPMWKKKKYFVYLLMRICFYRKWIILNDVCCWIQIFLAKFPFVRMDKLTLHKPYFKGIVRTHWYGQVEVGLTLSDYWVAFKS